MGLALTCAVAEGVLHRDQQGHYCLPDYRPGGLHNRLPAGASSAVAAAAAARGIRTEAAADRATGVRSGDVADVADVRLKKAKAEVLPGGGGGAPPPGTAPLAPGRRGLRSSRSGSGSGGSSSCSSSRTRRAATKRTKMMKTELHGADFRFGHRWCPHRSARTSSVGSSARPRSAVRALCGTRP